MPFMLRFTLAAFLSSSLVFDVCAKIPVNQKPEQQLPYYIKADLMDYEKETDTIKAIGHVEVSQIEKDAARTKKGAKKSFFSLDSSKQKKSPYFEKYLKADTLIYDRKNNVIRAKGNVVFIDENGNTAFADSMIVTDKFDQGFIQTIKLLMADDGRMTASKAIRKDDSITMLYKGTYSPCKICGEKKETPLWQLRASKVTHNQKEEIIYYENVKMDFYGYPFLYFPYFYHPDPSVKRKSGLLMPTYGSSLFLGPTVKVPYFYVISPDKDMTISPIITAKQGPILQAQYRQRFHKGSLIVDGSYTKTLHMNREELRKANPTLDTPPKNRFHLFALTRYEINDHYLFTADIQRASDTTYLRKYTILGKSDSFAQNKNLTSTIKIERFYDRSYAGIKSYVYQTDNPKTTPYVFPMAQYLYETTPGRFGERWTFDSRFLSLMRQHGVRGDISKGVARGIINTQFELPYVTPGGQLIHSLVNLRGDIYHINNYQAVNQSHSKSYSYARLIPTGSVKWSYPLVKQLKALSWQMEPIVEGIASPSGNNPVKIPNEDSRLSELDDLNLFFINRMSGYDRVDDGIRVVYGLNNSFYDRSYRSVSVFVGKSQRLNNRTVDLFGDYRKSSDLVIRSRMITAPWFKVHYRGRLDHKNYHPKLTEIGTNIGKPILQLNTNYVFVKKTETFLNQDIHQINWQLLSKVNDHWSLGFTQSRNLIKHQRANLAHMLNVSYENDCFKITAGVYKTGYRDRDIRPDSGFLVQFNFKNLGTIQPLSSGSAPNISFRNLGV